MSVKSETCFGKATGKPLSEYFSENEAQDAAMYVNEAHDCDMVPYNCKKCGMWHLSPRDRHTPSEKCSNCTDGDGKPKRIYRTREDAERRAEILKRERSVQLRVYECPYNNGYHLTKNGY